MLMDSISKSVVCSLSIFAVLVISVLVIFAVPASSLARSTGAEVIDPQSSFLAPAEAKSDVSELPTVLESLIDSAQQIPPDAADSILKLSSFRSCFPANLEVPSAVVVGPRSLITAAHVIKGKMTVFTRSGKSYSAGCEKADGFKMSDESSPDLALCTISNARFKGPHETVNLDPAIDMQNTILLGGFGGLGLGFALAEVRQGEILESCGTQLRVRQKIIEGDSGSPAYAVLDGTISAKTYCDGQPPRRIVIGINSRHSCEDECASSKTPCALISRTSSSANWIRKFAADNNVKICGVNVADEDDIDCRPVD